MKTSSVDGIREQRPHAGRSLWAVVVLFLTRRKRWEKEALKALDEAHHAARKLRLEMQRGTVEPKAEYDWLIEADESIQRLRQGWRNFDKHNDPAQPHGK